MIPDCIEIIQFVSVRESLRYFMEVELWLGFITPQCHHVIHRNGSFALAEEMWRRVACM